MNDIKPSQSPSARIWLPDVPWNKHIRVFMMRDTRGCHLGPKEQFNRFPSSPYCFITWYLEGEGELLSCGGRHQHMRLARCVVNGCQSAPTITKNCGDVHKFIVLFHPDAFHALFDINLAPLHNQFADARDVLPPHGLELIDAVFQAQSHEERQEVIKRFISQHAQAATTTFWTHLRSSSSIRDGVTLASVSAMLGVGPRQLQRRALRETGLNLQTLIKLWRSEHSHLSLQPLPLCDRKMAWADNAIKAGYADQSHWGRDCKAYTGHTPTQHLHAAGTEEADWICRLEIPVYEDSHSQRNAVKANQ